MTTDIDDLDATDELDQIDEPLDTAENEPGALDREAVVHGYVRELVYERLPMPSLTKILAPADLVGLSDAAVHALIDCNVVSTQCGTRRQLLQSQPAFVAILVAGARRLGVRPLRRLDAAASDLVQVLRDDTEPPAHDALQLVNGAIEHLMFNTETPLEELQPLWRSVLTPLGESKGAAAASAEDAISLIETIGERLIAQFRSQAGFPALLAEAMLAKRVSANVLAQTIGMPAVMLQDWLKGATPSRSRFRNVAALEHALSVPAGTFTRHLPVRALKISTDHILTPEVRTEFESLMIPLACLGDDWTEIDDDERTRRIVEVRESFIETSPYRQLRLAMSAENRRYPPLPPQMDTEFTAICAFKQGKLVAGLKHKLRHETDRRRQGGTWKRDTEALQKQILRRLLGCASDLMKGDDAAMAATDGASLILFCKAEAVQRMVHEMARRRFFVMKQAGYFDHRNAPENGMVFIESDASKVWMIAGMLSQQTGYLRKHRPQLTPVPGWIDADWIARASVEWLAVADEERELMADFAKQLESEDMAVREPRSNVQSLLDTDCPLQPVVDALARFDRDRPSYFESALRTARHDRDHLLLRLWMASRLRRENLTHLTYDPKGNRGKLRLDAHGVYLLVIPRGELKNSNSSAYAADGSDLVIELDPKDEALYEAIERWLDGPGSSRTILHGDDAGPFLFPGTTGPKYPIVSAAVYRIIVFFSALYLADLSFRPGVPGVRPFGIHTIRMLVATHILIHTGSFHDAANALFDDVATVEKAYAWLTHRQQSRLTNKLLDRIIERHPPTRPRLKRP